MFTYSKILKIKEPSLDKKNDKKNVYITGASIKVFIK